MWLDVGESGGAEFIKSFLFVFFIHFCNIYLLLFLFTIYFIEINETTGGGVLQNLISLVFVSNIGYRISMRFLVAIMMEVKVTVLMANVNLYV